MRRTALLMSVLSLVTAAGLGCKHVGGKCDCQQNPADAIMPGPTTPYAATPITTVPAVGAATAPTPMPLPR